MKRILTYLFLLAATVTTLHAMPAYPGKITLRQANGTTLTVYLRGDEHYSMAFTEDGYPLLFNPSTDNYEYAVLNGDDFTLSGIAAKDALQRTAGDNAFLKANVDISKANTIAEANFKRSLSVGTGHLFTAKSSKSLTAKASRAPQANKIRISDIPTTGKQKVLVLLVQFPDLKFQTVGSNPKQFYTDILNKKNYTNQYGATGSAYDYYSKSSNGLYDPEFVVVGPVTMPKQAAYYGQDMGTYHDINLGELVFHATELASLEGLVDYSQFDADGDKNVDNVYIFFAGYGQADTGRSNSIWPCSGYLHDDFEATMVLNGDTINRFAISQEINGKTGEPVGISTFVHEYAHVLGLADHYNSINQGAGGVGDWDVMGTGPYNNNQNTPPLMSAFEQAELGWLNYTELGAKTDSIITVPSLDSHPMGLKVNVEGKPNEYFVIENRQQTGWDTYLPGHGIIVWHVDMDSTAWLTNRVNADPQHQHLKLVEADGTPDSDAGDAFPGSKDITKYTFTDVDGKPVYGFDYVEELGNATGDARFVLSNSGYKPAVPASLKAENILGHQATLSWNAVKDADKYDVKVLLGTDTILKAAAVDTTSLTVKGLDPSTDYTAMATAIYGPFASEPASTAFSTTIEQYQEKAITANPATAVGNNSFTANWLPLADSKSYKVLLYKNLMSGTGSEGWDFTDKANDKPEGWATNCNRFDNNNFGNSAPALRLSKDGEYVMATHDGGKVTNLSFWYKASTTGNAITVEACKGGEWSLATDSIKPVKGDTVRVSLPIDNADSVRIVFHRLHTGYVTVDDINMEYAFVEYHAVDSATVASPCNYTFTGLGEGETYSYVVVGNNGEHNSLSSNRISVKLNGIANGITEVNTDGNSTANNKEMYNLGGVRVGETYRGVVITNGRKFIKKR